MTVSAKSDSEDIRLYIDGILHIRIPRDKNIKLQSWIEGHRKIHIIEIWSNGHQDRIEYEERELWIQVLELLDKHL